MTDRHQYSRCEVIKACGTISRSLRKKKDCNLAILLSWKNLFFSQQLICLSNFMVELKPGLQTTLTPHACCFRGEVSGLFSDGIFDFPCFLHFTKLLRHIAVSVVLMNKSILSSIQVYHWNQSTVSWGRSILPDLQLDFLPFDLNGLHFKVNTC